MRGSNFVFDSAQVMHFKCNGVTFKPGVSHIDSPVWLKNEKATINLQNGDNCFQQATTVALNYKEIETHPERVSDIAPFIKNIAGME